MSPWVVDEGLPQMRKTLEKLWTIKAGFTPAISRKSIHAVASRLSTELRYVTHLRLIGILKGGLPNVEHHEVGTRRICCSGEDREYL